MAIPKMILRYSIIKTLAPFSIIFVELQPIKAFRFGHAQMAFCECGAVGQHNDTLSLCDQSSCFWSLRGYLIGN